MQPWLILQLLALLLLANGTPVIAAKIFGARYSYPLDGNVNLADGRRLFGPSKTIRGVGLAILFLLIQLLIPEEARPFIYFQF